MVAGVVRERTGQRVSSGLLVGLVLVASYAAVVGGLFSAAMAGLERGTVAEAPVRVIAPIGLHGSAIVPCVQGSPAADGSLCEPAASPEQWPEGEPLPVRQAGGLVAAATGAGPIAALLASAPMWGGLLAAGAVGLLLIPAVRTTTSGAPFARGNARRLAAGAVVIAVSWALVTAADYTAASMIIGALEAAPAPMSAISVEVPEGWLAPALRITWWPLLIGALLALLAAAVKQGTQLRSDTEGLV